jgi:diguanylate cyclase (GGDEF)-like protein
MSTTLSASHEAERAAAPESAPASPRVWTWLLSVSTAVPALLLLAALPGAGGPLYDRGPWVVVLVFIGFVLSEPMVFHVEARNEAVSFSPSDIPLALGVLMLSPWTLLAVRLVAAGAALVHWRRPPTFKLALNLAAFTLETVVTVVAFRAVVALGVGLGPALWVGLIIALLVGLVAGGVTIAAAISLFEGGLAGRVRKEFTHSYLFYLPGAVLGASAAVPYLVAPWLVLLFVVPAPLVWVILRSHGSLMHRFVDLSQIHAFSSQVGRSTHLDDIATTAVEEIAGHLRAKSVALVVWGETGRMVEATVGDAGVLSGFPDGPADWPWFADMTPGEPWSTTDAEHHTVTAALRSVGVVDALVVALGDETDLIGVLVVADRHGAFATFDAHDIERLRTLAQQLTVALRKGQLHVQIQHKALHDRLTGLANRSYFDAWAAQHLDDNPGRSAAVLMIDLDRFKEVNDTLGHHAGDQLLVEITRRLEAAVDRGAMVARFGGDEFAIFMSDIDVAGACRLADAVSDALEAPISLDEITMAIAGSIGIAVTPVHGTDLSTLLRRADMAMYDAKRQHDRYAVFHPGLEGTDSTRLALLADLRSSLANGKIDVHFQPQRNVRSLVVCSVEALARWHHPVHGFVSPDVFVTLAERVGLIWRLTELVLAKALEAVRHWLDDGREIGVAVNISAQSLVSDNFPQLIAAALQRANVPAHLLTLEITERAMIGDSPRTVEVLEQLDRLGVRLSVDDFGTGYSSMMNLRHLPISELKIDRSFVTEMLVGGNDEVIVSSTVALGHNLGMSVVAEGVETPEVEARLRSAGCDIAQGYGIARPLPLEQLDEFLRSSRTRPTPERWRQRTMTSR